jgi:hypothetical protein
MTALAVALVVVLAAGVSTAGKGNRGPSPEAQAFWDWVSQDNPYQGWGFWPGHDGLYPGQSPHGKYLKLYANSIALKAAREGKTTLPAGSILMKANYAEDKETLKSLTPMYKVEGYNPEAGDWFWAKYKPNGKVLASGKVESCIQCHRTREDEGWVFTSTEAE